MWVVKSDIAGVSMRVYAGFQPVSIKLCEQGRWDYNRFGFQVRAVFTRGPFRAKSVWLPSIGSVRIESAQVS